MCRRRIARGSGYKEAEVAELVAVFTGMRAQMGNFSKMMKMGGGEALRTSFIQAAECANWGFCLLSTCQGGYDMMRYLHKN